MAELLAISTTLNEINTQFKDYNPNFVWYVYVDCEKDRLIEVYENLKKIRLNLSRFKLRNTKFCP